MNPFINRDFNNKINLYKNINIQFDPQRKNYKMIKEYYKSKQNMDNFIKNLKSQESANFLENFELI